MKNKRSNYLANHKITQISTREQYCESGLRILFALLSPGNPKSCVNLVESRGFLPRCYTNTKRKVLLVVLTAIFVCSTYSVTFAEVQPIEVWNVTWGGPSDDEGRAVATAGDCVYLAGAIGDVDAFLNRYDIDGNLLWNITWSGPGCYAAFDAAASGDSVYVAGREGHKAFLNRYDDIDGSLIWNMTSFMEVEGIAAGDHVVYAAGTDFDAGLKKYSSTDGSLIWNITDSKMSWGSATAATGDSVYLAGANRSSDFVFSNASLTKYNSTDGSLIWNITWGKAGWVSGHAVAATNDCVYLAGTTAVSDTANGSAFLVKYSDPAPSPTVTPVPTPATTAPIETPTAPPAATPTPPGFEAVFAIAGLLAVAFLVWITRRN